MQSPLNKILVANRGEIALRIIRTAKKMGIHTVSLYTENENSSRWVNESDETYPLGNGPLSETWLNIEKITGIALDTGADAIHPGYGFLAENHHFAEACESENIVFIGPSASVLQLMGDKIKARDWVSGLGIPVPPSFCGNHRELILQKNSIEYPVIVKAVAGGGGKGMRLVSSPADIERVMAVTSSEALHYFGDDRVYIEKYIENARHIEIQVLGDRHGNIRHLFERECSVQRRHQKLIEESRSSIPESLLNDLIRAALRIAGSLNYQGAGTVEFLVEPSGNYCFIEMNPRIQVEHGVTELITGIDIVAEQIRIAGGLRIAFRQDDIRFDGHAIEARLYAEDPENDLLPSPGTVRYISFPQSKNLRIECAVTSDDTIAGNVDPLIAKLLIHAPSRIQAVELLNDVVKQTIVTGISHNLSLLNIILADDDFRNNRISTTWLGEKLAGFSSIIAGRRKDFESVSRCAAAIMILNSYRQFSAWDAGFWRNVNRIWFRSNDTHIDEIEYERKQPGCIDFYGNDEKISISEVTVNGSKINFRLNGRPVELYVNYETDSFMKVSDGHLVWQWEQFRLRSGHDYTPASAFQQNAGNMVKAPQPGTVLNIRVSEGQQVNRGDYLLTIESMKLENTILATCEGLVKKIAIKAGDRVKKDEPLIYLQDSINN